MTGSNMASVAFSIGSNQGDKIATIKTALDELHSSSGLFITKASSFYRTKPWGLSDQDWFVNICALGETSLSPQQLLTTTQTVERKLGRSKTVRWGPRIIDIDILLYAEELINDENLTIPHPEMHKRAFVLLPLTAISTGYSVRGNTIETLLANIQREVCDVVELDINPWSPKKPV